MTTALRALRILDRRGELSLTNLSVLGALGLGLAEGFSDPWHVLALLVTLVNYTVKKLLELRSEQAEKKAESRIDALGEELARVKAESDMLKNEMSRFANMLTMKNNMQIT